eukprot:g4386.t1
MDLKNWSLGISMAVFFTLGLVLYIMAGCQFWSVFRGSDPKGKHLEMGSSSESSSAVILLGAWYEEPRRGGEPKRRRLSNKTPAPVGVRDPIETWLPRLLAAGLPRLSGALVKDHRGLSVLPHPHRMEKKILTSGARCLLGEVPPDEKFRKNFVRPLGLGDEEPKALEILEPDEGQALDGGVSQRLGYLVSSPVSNGLTGDPDRDHRLVEMLHLNAQMDGYWRLMPNGSPVGTISNGYIVWDSNYEASEPRCALQFLGRGVMMVLEGRTYHGSLTLSSGTPVIRWNDGEVWYRADRTDSACCRLSR